MREFIKSFWSEESGQDLIEYSLLITFIAVATAAVVGSGQNVIRGIWSGSNSTVAQANTAAS